MDHRALILRDLPGVAPLPEPELHTLARAFRLMDVLDAVLCAEGAPAEALFVLAEGTCAVTRRTAAGAVVPVATLRPGAMFGHLALLRPGPRLATVTSQGPARLLELPLERARALLESGPQQVSSALRRALIVATSRQLAGATAAAAALARAAGRCEADPGPSPQAIPTVEESEILLADPRW